MRFCTRSGAYLLVCLLSLFCQAAGGADWPQFLGPAGNGISTETGLLKEWPSQGPPMIWEKKIGAGYSAPSIRAGKAVVFYREEDQDDRIGSVLLRVDPNGRSVKESWRGTSLEIHWSTPIYHDGYLYAFSGRNEPDARFRCVEWKSGKIMWDRDEIWPHHSPETPKVHGQGSAILAHGKFNYVPVGARRCYLPPLSRTTSPRMPGQRTPGLRSGGPGRPDGAPIFGGNSRSGGLQVGKAAQGIPQAAVKLQQPVGDYFRGYLPAGAVKPTDQHCVEHALLPSG
jgi:hypothetical protein